MKKILSLMIVLLLFTFQVSAKKSLSSITSKKNVKQITSTAIRTSSTIPGELNKHSVGIGLGETFLYGDFDKNGDDAITMDIYYTYSASYSFDMIANVHYSKHSFKGKRSEIPGITFGIKSKIYQIDSFGPYIFGGFGFYNPTLTRENNGVLEKTDGKVTFGNHFGAGVDLRLNSKYSVGALAHYHNPFDVKQENGAKVEGSYFKLLMTTSYTF